jgi:hypothetical protein
MNINLKKKATTFYYNVIQKVFKYSDVTLQPESFQGSVCCFCIRTLFNFVNDYKSVSNSLVMIPHERTFCEIRVLYSSHFIEYLRFHKLVN